MQKANKFLQAIGIPHSAFLSVIFGMMILSFPMGMFVVFHTDIGDEINFELPLSAINLGLDFELGDIFILAWSLYLILFTVAILGSKISFLKAISPILGGNEIETRSNYMIGVTKWFSIIILVSFIIDIIQGSLGLSIIPPVQNELEQFFLASMAPLLEEVGFRVLLIGLPLYAFYTHRFSFRYLLKSLWNPSTLHIYSMKKPIILVILVSIVFGFVHIVGGESWSDGKFAQATAIGIILGWVYIRYGLIVAILVHWATNYFIFAYLNFIIQVNDITMNASFSHPLITVMEIIFVVSGILSVSIMVVKYLSKV